MSYKSQEKLLSLFDDLKTIFNNNNINNNKSNVNENVNENINENEYEDKINNEQNYQIKKIIIILKRLMKQNHLKIK